MSMNDLLFLIRQHPSFQDFLKELRPPPIPRYRKGDTLEDAGAKHAYESGRHDQYDRFHALLTGRASQDDMKE